MSIDDFLLFGNGTIEEWNTFHDFIKVLSEASRIEFNIQKSSFLINAVEEKGMEHIKVVFPFKMEPANIRFKYPRYFLKSNYYLKKDYL